MVERGYHGNDLGSRSWLSIHRVFAAANCPHRSDEANCDVVHKGQSSDSPDDPLGCLSGGRTLTLTPRQNGGCVDSGDTLLVSSVEDKVPNRASII